MAQYLYIWVGAYWFSMTSFSKWLPGGHIRFFGFWMVWFQQRNSGLLWNFSFKFHVYVLCGCRQKPNDCQLCRFQNGCLVILNSVQLQSTHCPLPPSPMGRGYSSRSLIYNVYFISIFIIFLYAQLVNTSLYSYFGPQYFVWGVYSTARNLLSKQGTFYRRREFRQL